jgi:hypothetical protein
MKIDLKVRPLYVLNNDLGMDYNKVGNTVL